MKRYHHLFVSLISHTHLVFFLNQIVWMLCEEVSGSLAFELDCRLPGASMNRKPRMEPKRPNGFAVYLIFVMEGGSYCQFIVAKDPTV